MTLPGRKRKSDQTRSEDEARRDAIFLAEANKENVPPAKRKRTFMNLADFVNEEGEDLKDPYDLSSDEYSVSEFSPDVDKEKFDHSE